VELLVEHHPFVFVYEVVFGGFNVDVEQVEIQCEQDLLQVVVLVFAQLTHVLNKFVDDQLLFGVQTLVKLLDFIPQTGVVVVYVHFLVLQVVDQEVAELAQPFVLHSDVEYAHWLLVFMQKVVQGVARDFSQQTLLLFVLQEHLKVDVDVTGFVGLGFTFFLEYVVFNHVRHDVGRFGGFLGFLSHWLFDVVDAVGYLLLCNLQNVCDCRFGLLFGNDRAHESLEICVLFVFWLGVVFGGSLVYEVVVHVDHVKTVVAFGVHNRAEQVDVFLVALHQENAEFLFSSELHELLLDQADALHSIL